MKQASSLAPGAAVKAPKKSWPSWQNSESRSCRLPNRIFSQALDAYSRFGKGIDPKARLNLGDCATYALAKVLNVPLLFKGVDFSQTDIQQYV
jgi:uncharacterized protein with PIN domain